MRRRFLLAALSLLPAAAPAMASGEAARRRRSADPDIVFPAPGRRAWAVQVPQIRIGLLGGENEADRLGRFGPYRDLLAATFGVEVRLFAAADFAGVVQAFSARQIEMAGMGPSGYAAAFMDSNGNVEPLLTTEEADGSISYVSVMVVRRDSGITSLEQMRGRSLAWADPNSTSGYLIPRFQLRAQGIGVEPGQFFGRTGFAGGHEQAVVAVLNRQYDAAVTWASGIGEESEGFTRGNLRAMVEKGLLDMRDLRVIWRSEPILNGPLTVRRDLPEAFKEDMRLFHLALPRAYPAIYRQIERGAGTGYREVTHADYELFVRMRQEEAAARRRRS
ncbi:MAG: phosphate/phosphite/phosphonate ABC transporter substrate-binding protein [Rhodovarius sp.]|nr:phosphate/phosphite/phosphonate ABC transporter substrate-binding protein [Rhodovarius sp.]